MKIILELEAADPEALLSSEALKAFITLERAGVEVTWVEPATGPTVPAIVARFARDARVARGPRGGLRPGTPAASHEPHSEVPEPAKRDQ